MQLNCDRKQAARSSNAPPGDPMNTSELPKRIVSMDQFRGFTVISMFLVHFGGRFSEVVDLSTVFNHNGNFLSFADTVLPSFLFAAGFSLRLSLLRRLTTQGRTAAYLRTVRRCLLLILLLELLLRDRWWPQLLAAFREHGLGGALIAASKGSMFESLSIIGAASLWALPVIVASARVRIAFACVGLLAHAAACHSFYFAFLYGQPNWLDHQWGTVGKLGAEGGVLGVLTWDVPLLMGSLAYDVIAASSPKRAAHTFAIWACGLLAAGYFLSCLANLYPVADPPSNREYELAEAGQVAASPVIPPAAGLKSADPRSIWATPPFVRPSRTVQRQLNYWIMGKRVATPSFILTATAFSLAVYALFVWFCDVGSLQIGVLLTFGQNPLAAYVIELYLLGGMFFSRVWPTDATLLWASAHSVAWFALTYLAVRLLEWRGIYWRL
jgi:predicted acyltransferase